MTEPAWLLCMVWQLSHRPVTLARVCPEKAVVKATAIIDTDMVKKILFIMVVFFLLFHMCIILAL
ncbi:MAG: hypothetical protein JRJ38_15570 [Deltaproteobacteria bacterium]|nr:hypothetical protein [Deltaproteobacteria bacterium]